MLPYLREVLQRTLNSLSTSLLFPQRILQLFTAKPHIPITYYEGLHQSVQRKDLTLRQW